MFLSHFSLIISGVFIGLGTNLLVSANPNVISAVLFLLAGVFLSFSAYINSTVYEACRIGYGSTAKNERKNYWIQKFELWRIKVRKDCLALLCLIFSILFSVIAVILIKIAH